MRILQRYVLLQRDAELLAELDRLAIPYDLTERNHHPPLVVCKFFLYEDDPASAEKTAALQRFALGPPSECIELSSEDVESAEWFQVEVGQTGYPQPEGEWFEHAYGTEGACGTCGHHERQTAPFRFAREPAGKSHFLGLNWAFEAVFARDEVLAAFEEEGISGVGFSRPVLHRSGAPLRHLWQLEVRHTLGDALHTRNLVSERCEPVTDDRARRFLTGIGSRLVDGPFCGRVKYNYPRRELMTFDAAALAGAPDVVITRDLFGSGGSANRVMLVSRRVRDAVRDRKLKGATFRPVRLA